MIGIIKRVLFQITLVLLGGTGVLGQTGAFFKTHFNPSEENFDNTNYAISQDTRGVMHFANKQGVLHFDGNGWWLTPVPFSVYCMVEDADRIYVGGREGFGYIINSSAREEYFPIDTLTRDILKATKLGTSLYYITDKELFRVETTDLSPIKKIDVQGRELLDIVLVDEKIYLSTEDGLFGITEDDKIEALSLVPMDVFFIREAPSGSILYLTDSSTIYTEYKGKVEKLNFENRAYLEDHTVTEITWASDSLIAISTLSGGILFVNVSSGETVQIVDYDTGLPDNQIIALYRDDLGGIWVAHNYGMSVISPQIPLRSFNHYPGLRGSLITVLPFKNHLYVGTSLGVYKLVEKKQVKESVIYDRIRVRIDVEEVEQPEEVKPQKRGLFKRRRKVEEKEEEKVAAPQYKYVYRKRVIEEELSRSYEFVKIGGLNAKCVQLMHYNNRLLAGSVQGLYQIEEDTALLISEIPVLHMYGLGGKNLAFVSTTDEEVRVFSRYSGKWVDTNMLEGLNDYIYQISLDPEKNIWLCGADSLYRIQLDGRDLVDVEVYGIENPYFDKVYSVNYNGRILFINSSGYFGYQDLSIVRLDSIEDEIGLPKKFILGSNGQLLINTGNNWYGAGSNIRRSLNFLSFFKDPLAIARDDSYNYWVTTASNDLYRVHTAEVANLSGHEEIYLKEVRNNDVPLPIGQQMKVDQEGSQLSFEFASPDYTGIYRKEYKFRLTNATGTQSPWSNWSENNNIVSYQFLPPGSYTLEASFRNSLGKVVNAEPFKFKIVAPYWNQPWFYVLEVLFFSGLLIFSFYLNHGRGKYVVISRLLGFLTLIFIVEFFQTLAGFYYEADNSPVINFFIQAFIALLLLPLESVLRHYLTRKPEEKLAKKKAD